MDVIFLLEIRLPIVLLTIEIVAAEESCGIKRSYQELYLRRELVPLLAYDIELIVLPI